MKKLLFALTLVPLIALGDTGANLLRASEAQALTRAAPAATDFTTAKALKLHWINGYHVMLCAAAGQTLSGAGSLQAYRFDENTGLVSRNPDLDLTVTVTSTSCGGAACRCQNWADTQMAQSEGWLLYAANGVTVSSGTVTVYYFGYSRIK